MMNFIDSQTSQVLSKALDGAAMRNQAIAANIANAETPGYETLSVDFEGTLKNAIDTAQKIQNGAYNDRFLPPGALYVTDPRHINPKPLASSIGDVGLTMARTAFEYRKDGNGVDIEQQMAMLAKNAQKYQALSKLEAGNYTELKNIIKSGGG